MTGADIVVDLVKLHDGKLIGRTRLQKEAYLLNLNGADFQVEFVYHYFGPYSFELADGILEACEDGPLATDEPVGRYGIRYTIFSYKGSITPPKMVGKLSFRRAKNLIESMEKVSDIVLELAATIAYLRDSEGYAGRTAVDETRARKPLKANDVRINKAIHLLDELDLSGGLK